MFIRRSLFVILLSLALGAPLLLSAQNSVGSKTEVFGGYSGYRAGGSVNGVKVPDFTDGWAGQIIFSTGKWTGLLVDVNGHHNSSAAAHDLAVGPRFQLPIGHFSPFAEALLGIQHFSLKSFPTQNTPTYIFGTGIDVRISDRFSIRPFQISYVNTVYTPAPAGSQNIAFNGVRVQSGLIYHLGLPAPEGEVSAACKTDQSSVDAGMPLKIDVEPKGFLPSRVLRYSYASTGGKVEGAAASASVNTAGVEPGSYTISANVADNGKGKHRRKASCQATFAVSAKPAAPAPAQETHAAVQAVPAPEAQTTAIPAAAVPAAVSATQATAAPVVPAPEAEAKAVPLLTASSADTASATQTAKVQAVPAPVTGPVISPTTSPATAERTSSVNNASNGNVSAPVETAQLPLRANRFGSIAFLHDRKRPTRVDNTAKAELDRYADALAASPDAKGVVVGYATAKERAVKAGNKKAPNLAALRAVNTKDYLSKDKGIDPTRIKPRAGHGRKTVKLWIVPAGATFRGAGTKAVNEAKVKAIPRVALKEKKTAHKKQVRK